MFLKDISILQFLFTSEGCKSHVLVWDMFFWSSVVWGCWKYMCAHCFTHSWVPAVRKLMGKSSKPLRLEINHHKRIQASTLYCQMVHWRKHHSCLNYLAACFIQVCTSAPAKHLWKQLFGLKVVNNQTKDVLVSCHSKTKKHKFAHATQCFAHRQTLGSGLGFIREMHSIAISGKHILPCTYPLIALLLQRQDRWLYIWRGILFQLANFSGSVAMCPTGTVREADNLNRAKLGLNSLTVSWTKNTLDVTNEDWIV